MAAVASDSVVNVAVIVSVTDAGTMVSFTSEVGTSIVSDTIAMIPSFTVSVQTGSS